MSEVPTDLPPCPRAESRSVCVWAAHAHDCATIDGGAPVQPVENPRAEPEPEPPTGEPA